MSRFSRIALALAAVATLAGPARALDDFHGVGRAATPAEIKAWDIDVRPDFKGLPKGAGTVEQGEKLWEAKVAPGVATPISYELDGKQYVSVLAGRGAVTPGRVYTFVLDGKAEMPAPVAVPARKQ